jgi:hypothetical protein
MKKITNKIALNCLDAISTGVEGISNFLGM